MELVTPGLGLIFWQTIVFLIVLFLLSRLVWPKIMGALNEREQNIADALASAEKARKEMAALQSENENLLKEARSERDRILREAQTAAGKIIADARQEAQGRAAADLDAARSQIATEKAAAIAEIRNTVATMSLAIAGKVLRTNLDSVDSQKALVQQYLTEAEKSSFN